jgi:hypothetical protein
LSDIIEEERPFEIMILDFDAIEQLLIIYFAFVRHWRKRTGVQWNSTAAVYRLQEIAL